METTLFPELRILTNMPDASTDEMHNVCNYIFWAKANYLELNFEMTEDQFNQCSVSYQRKNYRRFDATYELVYQPTFEYLKTLLEFSKIVQDELAWQDAEMFMHYFNMTGNAQAMPKFVFYSAHAETIAPISRAFGHATIETPDPSFMVFVHFYENACADNSKKTCYSVEGVYVPHWRLTDKVIKVFSLSIDEFEKWVNASLDEYVAMSGVGTRDVVEMCEQKYVRSPEDPYTDPWLFRTMLYKHFDYDPPSMD